MSSQKTANLKLHKWVKSDPIKMTEFNENFQKIDAAIAAGAKIATGSYVGTGTYGSSNPCSLTFDFAPRLFMLFWNVGLLWKFTSGDMFMINLEGIETDYKRLWSSSSNSFWAKKSEDGRTISWYYTYNANAQCNYKGDKYFYVAIA